MKKLFLNNKLLRDFIKFSYGTWGGAIVSFITVPIVTRLIIPDEFGKASMFLLAYHLLMRFCYVGADQSLVRHFYEVDENERPKLLWSTLVTPIVMISVVSVLLIFEYENVSLLLYDGVYFESVIILTVLLFAGIVKDHAINIVRMKNYASLYSNVILVENIVNTSIIIVYATFINASFYAIIFGLLLSTITSLLIALLYTRSVWLSDVSFSKSMIKNSLIYGVPFVPTFIFTWVLQGMDKLAIKHFVNLADVGLYASAFKIIAILQLLKTGFQNFWIPLVFDNYENNVENKSFLEKMAKTIFPISFVLAILIILSKDILILLLGEEYRDSVIIVPFLIFIPLVGIVKELTGKGIDFSKKTYWHIVITFVIAAANLVLNYILVPKYSIVGAAVATSLAYISYLILNTYISQKYYKVNYGFGKIITLITILYTVVLVDKFLLENVYSFYLVIIFATLYIYRKSLYFKYGNSKH